MAVVDISARTDPGRDPAKQVNEDAFGERATAVGHLAFVCDGMGGHENGREASTLAVQTILEWFANTPAGGSPRDALRGAIEEANRRVFRLGGPAQGTAQGASGGVVHAGHAGSTCVAVLVHPGGTEVAHVGDSRAFLIHAGTIFQVTRDHSMVQQMVDAQLLTAEQAAHHPEANKITRALGIAPDVEVELRAQPLIHAAGDVLVLCSDGLTDLVSAQDIADVLQGVALRARRQRSGRSGQRARRPRQRDGAAGARPRRGRAFTRAARQRAHRGGPDVRADPDADARRGSVRAAAVRPSAGALVGTAAGARARHQDAGGRALAAASGLEPGLPRSGERAHASAAGDAHGGPRRRARRRRR